MAKQPFSLDLTPPRRSLAARDRDPVYASVNRKRPPAKRKRGETQGEMLDRTRPDDTISQGFTGGMGAAENALDKVRLGDALRTADELFGVQRAEEAAHRLGKAYRSGEPMSGWDMFGVAAALPVSRFAVDPALRYGGKGLAYLGKKGYGLLPGAARGAVEAGAQNVAQWGRQLGPLFSRGEHSPLADLMADPGYVDVPFNVTPGAAAAPSMGQRRITNQRPVVQGLPAPEQRLALPAPGPGLPSFAIKSKGGQWWPNIDISEPFSAPRNYSPEFAVQRTINNQFVGDLNPEEQALRDWFEKAATRYIKTDLGTPEDPLRAVAEQGNLHIADMTPDQWSHRARMNIYAEPIGYYTVPPSAPVQTEAGFLDLNFGPEQSEVDQLLGAAPWLRKAPVTDQLHGLSQDASNQLGFHHLLDEMGNALNPQSGLPPELALDPRSLQRMGLAQASERVGLINQHRAKMAREAALSAIDNPATHTFKEYAENNPRGLRWVELRQPDELPEGWVGNEAEDTWTRPNGEPALGDPRYGALSAALKYEGDTMGHCVGGYCDDVLQGRSRIFSLRDAKGEPHVTIETAPKRAFGRDDRNAIYDRAFAEIDANPEYRQLSAEERNQLIINRQAELADALRVEREAKPVEDIIQIKGKQNRAPKDDYLPFVQDFVKSGQWGNVGDLGNTGLVKLPDGRYITAQQAEEGIAAIPERIGNAVYDPHYLHAMDPDIWNQVAPHFQGYAIGGRVDAERCFCHNPLAVKRTA